MNILVTGANGFIGRALVPALRAQGHTVRGAVRRPARVDEVAVPDLARPDADWSPAVGGIDVVVHLAGRAHVMQEHALDPLVEYRRVNAAGTLHLARQAADHGVRRFVFISTVKVNGEQTEPGRPFVEEDAPAPGDAYGQSKAEAEAGLADLAPRCGMEFCVIRPTLVYGPGVRANFLSMARWLQRGVPLPFAALTANRRSLVGVDNLNSLIATCAVHPAAANQVFLAADGDDLSTAGLLRRTATALGVRARLFYVPPAMLAAGASVLGARGLWQRLGGSLQVSTRKAQSLLGWRPPLTVDEGLALAVQSLVDR